MASVVAVRKYDLYGRTFFGLPVGALGEGRVGVGRGDLDELGVVEDLLHGLGDGGVQRADDAEDVLVGDELGGVLLARGGLRLVVEGLDLEGDAFDVLLLVGRLGGEVDGVLDAEAQRGQVAGQRGVDADGDGGPPLPVSEPPFSSREPQAVRVSAPAASAAVMAMSER